LSDEKSIEAGVGKIDILLVTAASEGQSWDLYLKLLKFKGVLVLISTPPDGIKFSSGMYFVLNNLTLTGTCSGSAGDIKEMLDFCAKFEVKPQIELLPMSECNTAFKKVHDNDVKYRAVLYN